MARIKRTPEEIQAILAERKAIAKEKSAAARQSKKEARQAEWNARVATARVESLAGLSDEVRQEILAVFQAFKDGIKFNPLQTSILGQFNNYGKLSEKQVNILVNATSTAIQQKAEMLESEKDFFDEFKEGERYDLRLKLISAEEIQNPSHHQYAPAIVRVYRFKSTSHQIFKITSNNKKLEAIFTETGKWHKLSTGVRFVAPQGKHIVLNPVGIKFSA